MLFLAALATFVYNCFALVYVKFLPHSMVALTSPKTRRLLERIFPPRFYPVEEEHRQQVYGVVGISLLASLYYLWTHHHDE